MFFNYYLLSLDITKPCVNNKFIETNFIKTNSKLHYFREYKPNLKNKQLITKNCLNDSFYFKNISTNFFFNKKFISNSWLWTLLFKNLAFSFLKYKTEWLFLDVSTLAKNGKFFIIWYKCYRKYKIKNLYMNKNVFIIWFTQLTYLKDVRGVLPIFKKILLKTHLKKHKKIFFIIRTFFRVWFKWAKKYQNVKGFSLFFKGKLGRKGSVRKLKFFSKQGLVSYTNKNLRVNYENYIVWTHTGVIGCCISIFF